MFLSVHDCIWHACCHFNTREAAGIRISATFVSSSPQEMQPTPRRGSQASTSSGVSWLLDVIESGHTLPPLEVVLASPELRSEGMSPGVDDLFQRWTTELEKVSPAFNLTAPSSGSSVQLEGRKIKISPYIAHKTAPNPHAIRTVGKPMKTEATILADYMQMLKKSASPNPEINHEDAKLQVSLAVSAHISKEAALKSKVELTRRSRVKKVPWVTVLRPKGCTFDDFANERRLEELNAHIFANARTTIPLKFPGRASETENATSTESILNNRHPPSSCDPLYRIMREESELEDTRSKVFLVECATSSEETKRVEREQLLISSKQLIRAQELETLRRFGTISSDMWVTMRAVYFLFISYFEVMFQTETETFLGVRREKPELSKFLNVKPNSSVESSVPCSDEQFFVDMCPTLNMENLWDLVKMQCKQYDITTANVPIKFSWFLLQALLNFADEFTCALAYIERGEDTHDEKMAMMLSGKASAVDFWKNSRFYQKFPEENLPFLRAVVAPSMFTPISLSSKSISCARLCAWARRVTAGIFAAKSSQIRRIPFSSGDYFPHSQLIDAAIDDASVVDLTPFMNGDGSCSVAGGSVFDRSSLTPHSPKRRIEQYISYPVAGVVGLMNTSGIFNNKAQSETQIRRNQATTFMAVSAITPCAGEFDQSNYDNHISIMNATIILARPTDRLEMVFVDLKARAEEWSPQAIKSKFEKCAVEMSSILAKSLFENRILETTHSPLHHVFTFETSDSDRVHHEDGESYVSFARAKTFSQLPLRSQLNLNAPDFTTKMTDTFASATGEKKSFCVDIFITCLACGLPSSIKELQDQICSLALVFPRHWALASNQTPYALSISRFVVFISKRMSSMAAFKVCLFEFCHFCLLVFFIIPHPHYFFKKSDDSPPRKSL